MEKQQYKLVIMEDSKGHRQKAVLDTSDNWVYMCRSSLEFLERMGYKIVGYCDESNPQ